MINFLLIETGFLQHDTKVIGHQTQTKSKQSFHNFKLSSVGDVESEECQGIGNQGSQGHHQSIKPFAHVFVLYTLDIQTSFSCHAANNTNSIQIHFTLYRMISLPKFQLLVEQKIDSFRSREQTSAAAVGTRGSLVDR